MRVSGSARIQIPSGFLTPSGTNSSGLSRQASCKKSDERSWPQEVPHHLGRYGVLLIGKETPMQRKSLGLLAVAVALTATVALAQTSPTPPAGTGSPSAQGMPMMGMMHMMMGQNGMADHVEGRIAFLKTELKITDAQQPLWNAVADAMRASAKDMAEMMMAMRSTMQQSSGTLPDKLAARERAMTAHLDALRKLKAAVDPLYAALSDDQKKT